MTFEEWFKAYWKPTALGGAFDAAVREVAESAWEAATAAEREACAKVCDFRLQAVNGDYADGWNDASAECAAAIRAR